MKRFDFLDLLFPPRCAHCARYTAHSAYRALCDNCLASIPLHRSLFCGACSARLPDLKKVCHFDFPYVLAAASSYGNEPVRDLIHALKFSFLRDAVNPIADIMFAYAESLHLFVGQIVLVPIPLSAKRVRERGYNQSNLIAERLSLMTGTPLLSDVLLRTRDTLPQSSFSSFAEREENVRKCFRATLAPTYASKTILLIDDVATSGRTLYEASQALRHAGARRIIGLVLARAS